MENGTEFFNPASFKARPMAMRVLFHFIPSLNTRTIPGIPVKESKPFPNPASNETLSPQACCQDIVPKPL